MITKEQVIDILKESGESLGRILVLSTVFLALMYGCMAAKSPWLEHILYEPTKYGFLETRERVQAITKKMLHVIPPEYGDMVVEVVPFLPPNAMATRLADGRLVVAITMSFATLATDEQIATVMGHEIAHHMLGHLDEGHVHSYVDEYNCDVMGWMLALQAGFDICASRSAFDIIINDPRFRPGMGASSHPNLDMRASVYERMCKTLKNLN